MLLPSKYQFLPVLRVHHISIGLMLFAILVLGGSVANAQVTVGVASGDLTGVTAGDIEEFLGIPYAQPPVGPLRWHAPQPPHSWEGIREAKQTASPCPQKAAIPGPSDPSTNEDCLYLNVYRPSGNLNHEPYAVMVWIHGGSNTNGSGADYDPSQMVRENGIIVVTVNYRLGVLGWLPVPTMDSPQGRESGNFGLMDQQAALAWVQKNISSFGGDSSKVTVAGESSGAFGICASLASPKARGLFQQAIMQSFECRQATKAYTVRLTRDIVKQTHCEVDKPEGVASCMNALPVSALLDAPENLSSVDPHITNVSFGAYVDGDVLPVQPERAVASGAWNRVPVLLGSDHDEAGTATFAGLEAQQLQEKLPGQQQGQQYWPLSESTYQAVMAAIYQGNASAIEAEYASAEYPTPFDALSALSTDSYVLGCGTSPQANIFALRTPTFRYEFSDPNTPLPALLAAVAGRNLGAYHSGELQYLFSESGYPRPQSPDQQALSQRMIHYWGNFVKNGEPGDGSNSPWPRYRIWDKNLLALSPKGDSVSSNFDTEHHCQFWRTLPPTVPSERVNKNETSGVKV